MAAWLADNSFSWSKLKKSITAVWKCNASAPEPHSATVRHQANENEEEEEKEEEEVPHVTGSPAEFITSTCYRARMGPRAGTEPQISRAASTSQSLLHSFTPSYSSSHLLCGSHRFTANTYAAQVQRVQD